MFENMNLDVMNEKEMESFIQGLTEIINLPEGTFKESGTMINTVIVKLYK